MRRLLLFILSLSAFTLFSCSGGDDTEPVNPNNPTKPTEASISINPSNLTFESNGSPQSITVTSSDIWRLSGGEDWCTPSKTSGENSDVISFSLQANESTTEERRMTYTFTCGDKTTKLTITQKKRIIVIHTVNVETKGTLKDILAEKGLIDADATHLKITGILGDLDYLTISELKNFAYLDISEIAVTTLPNGLFANNKQVQQIILPKTLIEINDYLFSYSSIQKIIIPTNVQTIGSHSFANCVSLTSINIPTSVEKIGYGAFIECISLKTVTFGENSKLHALGDTGGGDVGTFAGCISLTSIEIPASVEEIGNNSFKNCTSLTAITFEKGSQLKAIRGGGATTDLSTKKIDYHGTFSGCTSLTDIEIPAKVEEIGASAFEGCSSLVTVTFENGSQLKIIRGGYDNSNSLSYWYGAFIGCRNLKTFDASACSLLSSIEVTTFSSSPINLFKLGANVPPSYPNRSGNTFVNSWGSSSSIRILKVPDESVDVYKATNWQTYFTISGFNE